MNQTLAFPPPTPLERDIGRLKQWQNQNRHAEALAEAEQKLVEFPDNRDLMLIAAHSLRHLRRNEDALAMLARMERTHPNFSRLHEARGLCFIALKDAPRAIESLLRAVNLNLALPMSWRMLVGLYRMTGDEKNARTAHEHVDTLAALPPEVVQATGLYFDKELLPAEAIIRSFLLRNGDHPEAMRLLAKIGMERDVLDDAEILLEAAHALEPEHRGILFDWADCLVRRHRYAEAKVRLDRLLAIDPKHFDYRTQAAAAAVGLGDNRRALELYDSLLADAPPNSPGAADVQLWRGHALKTVGRVPEGIEAYRAATAMRPEFGEAYWSLANLKTYRFTDEEIATMAAAEAAQGTSPTDRRHLSFALGKAFEDRAEPDRAWFYYDRGNALLRAESRYRPEIIETNTAGQIRVCTRGFFDQRRDWGDKAADPIFVLGLPRSGSTLIEQILASHSQVEGTQELAEVQRYVLELQGRDYDLEDPRYPDVLADMSEADFARLGERYMADTRVLRSDKPFFIDKMPNNFRHIGLIHLILPNAKIIDARREPMACCFSNLKQLFAHGQEFTYGAEEIARYYRTYLELMRHWDEVLPGRVLRVIHEDVVDDLEGEVRRLLDYCGLPFEAGCVEFHKTRRSVRTPSSEQVRQPIFRDGLDQWRQFEPWLGQLREALGDAVDNWRE
jgi:tetratricopeptide (TPR) repeat protein